MNSAVCTLYEHHFHPGVAALANSLFASGYRGTLWVGYRGPLPPWASTAQPVRDGSILECHPEFRLHFIPVHTSRHLTNYKASFLLQVLHRLAPDATRAFYFDPDITVRFPWSHFEAWTSDTVALCEDVNSPIHDTHPKRQGWRKFFAETEHRFRNSLHVYLNGGFVALPRHLAGFLTEWDAIITAIGQSGIDLSEMGTAADYRFWFIDQDALNITAMATEHPLSIAGKEGMGFVPGNSPMVHAIGKHKPWHRGIIRRFLSGYPPTLADREFWTHVETPIQIFPKPVAKTHRRLQGLASFAGRFYRR